MLIHAFLENGYADKIVSLVTDESATISIGAWIKQSYPYVSYSGRRVIPGDRMSYEELKKVFHSLDTAIVNHVDTIYVQDLGIVGEISDNMPIMMTFGLNPIQETWSLMRNKESIDTLNFILKWSDSILSLPPENPWKNYIKK